MEELVLSSDSFFFFLITVSFDSTRRECYCLVILCL